MYYTLKRQSAVISKFIILLIKGIKTYNLKIILILLMILRNIVFFAILALLSINSFSQSPPIWGGNLQYSVNVSILYDKPVMKWNFTYYYNWKLKAERYEHHAPQADQMCLLANPPFGINESCIATFATDGWSYVEYPAHNWCCKCGNTFGAIRSDWLAQNSTYKGIQIVNGVSVTHWIKNGVQVNNYFSTVDKAWPVKFAQTKSGVPKQWTFDLKSYNDGAFDPDLLKPKCQNLCTGNCKLFRKTINSNLIVQQ